MAGTMHAEETTGDDGEDVDPIVPEEDSILGFVLVTVLAGYALVGVVVLGLAAYGLYHGWTLYAGRPFWAALCWPIGGVGLVMPAVMKLDDVTEVKRTPSVLGPALVSYGLAFVALVGGWLLSYYPIGMAGLAATVAFTVACAKYVWER